MKSIAKYIFVTAMAWFLLPGFSAFGQEEVTPEVMPYFAGCSDVKNAEAKRACSNEKLVSYLSANLSYPDEAKFEGIEGTVYLSFVVNENGMIEQVEVIRGIGGGCDAVAKDIVQYMPKWEPGSTNGQAVATQMNIPIQFSLGIEGGSRAEEYRIIWSNISDRESLTKDEVIQNLINPITLLDLKGNRVQFNELTFLRSKRRKFKDESSSGNITPKMRKLIKKLKPGNYFSIITTIQMDGEFEYIEKEWLIEKPQK